MIKEQLFNKFTRGEPYQIVKNVFNHYGGRSDFPRTVGLLLNKTGIVMDYDGCRFPGDLDEYELHDDYNGVPFEGVECWSLDDEITVSEDVFYEILKEACKRYIEMRPEKKDELEQITSQSTLI